MSNGGPWRDDPDFAKRFHPDHPDDLQVLVHDGEPRRTKRGPEACWVTVTGVHGTLKSPVASKDAKLPLPADAIQWIERKVYRGSLLNQPKQLASVKQGDDVLFIHAPGIPHALLVVAGYLRERPQWAIAPCDRCGADQSLDPPMVMARTRFPDAPPGSVPVAFTAFCPCGGTMMLSAIEGAPPGESPSSHEPSGKKPWWKIW